MGKPKNYYRCTNCGTPNPVSYGTCGSCGFNHRTEHHARRMDPDELIRRLKAECGATEILTKDKRHGPSA